MSPATQMVIAPSEPPHDGQCGYAVKNTAQGNGLCIIDSKPTGIDRQPQPVILVRFAGANVDRVRTVVLNDIAHLQRNQIGPVVGVRIDGLCEPQ